MNKILIASDIHGSAFWCKKLVDAFMQENADTLLLLGDLLYHGPRNPLPDGYAPMEVVQMLSALKEKIVCVRGNCDSEVDQMVLEFPIMANYAVADENGHTLFFTHGHLFNADMPPSLQSGDVLFNGHFHTPECRTLDNGAYYANCGSTALPKPDTPHSYILVDNGVLYWKDLETGGIFDCLTL